MFPLRSREWTVPEGIHMGTVLMKIILWLEVAALVKPQKWFYANLMRQLLFQSRFNRSIWFFANKAQTWPPALRQPFMFSCCKCSLTHKPDMEFLEVLTEGLERVLLVRGGGSEVITIYSWLASVKPATSGKGLGGGWRVGARHCCALLVSMVSIPPLKTCQHDSSKTTAITCVCLFVPS